jgi:iron complex outermembrane receptor protein
MKALWKAALLCGAAWSASAGIAAAQEPANNGTAVEEVVVTARRTSENLQKVPASVTAFTEKALERLNARDTTDLQGAVPNLNIVPGRGSSNATNIYIRGVGQPDALQTFDPAVGVYVDDVYYSRIRGTQFGLLDLERVEVLRGPQGTLYGKNTEGGALKFVTRKPGQDFRASGSVAYGSYNELDVKAAVSGPISDTVAVGVAALSETRDGYVTDPVLHREYNDKNSKAVRGDLAWTPNATTRIDFSADYAHDDAALNVGQPTSDLKTLIGGIVIYTVPTPLPEYDFKTRTTSTLPNSTEMTHWGASANASFKLSDKLTLKSITAFRALNTDDFIDIDATQLELGDVFVGVDQNQFSQEFQLAYTGERLTAVGGAFYLHEDVSSHQEAYADDLIGPLLGNPTFLRTIDDQLKLDSVGLYGNATYQFTDRLRVSAGVRVTDENKKYFRTTSTFSSSPLLTSVVPFAFTRNQGWTDVSPTVSVDYQATDDIMLYGRVAKGFKSGGFNGRANSKADNTNAYDPETVLTYEVGAKTQWFDKRLRANFAIFDSKYKDFQARVSGTDTDPSTGLPLPVLGVLNAGELKITGAELELQANPIPALLLDAQIGYLNSRYEEFDDARFTAFGGSRAFQKPAFSPDWTMRFGGQYEFGLGDNGSVTVGGQARYRSEMALAVDNTAVNSNVKLEGMWQDAYWLYDARVVWQTANRKWSAGVYGQNLSDEVYKTDAQEFSSVGNIRTAYFGAPRTFLFKVTARY